jgi:hypothetical protein
MNITEPRRVGNLWVFPNGRTLPVITGGDITAAPTTVDALRDERARVLNQIDDILNTATAEARALTDVERAEHDTLVAQVEGADGLDARIAAAVNAAADADRVRNQEQRRSIPVPNVNVRGDASVGNGVSRSLDEWLWASADSVRAGAYDKTGNFRYSPHGAVNSVEQVMVRSGEADDATPAPRITEFRPQDQQLIRMFQDTVADMALFGMMIDKDAKSSSRGFEVARGHRKFKDRWAGLMNALDADTAGSGGAWVPTGIGAMIHEKVRASGKVAPLFSRIDLPTNPWKWPIEGGDATAYRVAEPTSDTATKVAASTPGTVAPTFDAEIMGGRVLFSRSLEADSAIAILPFVRAKLVQAFVDAEEKAVLDGDADGTHQDTDTQAVGATHFSSAWDGLRKRALANASQATTTSTAANLALIRAAMGKWGINPADLAFIVGVSAYHDLLSDTNFLTVDKMGPNATILSGQLGAAYGVPVIVSEHVRENLNASGVHDAITTTKTYNLCVNRNEFAFGQRMATDVEVDDSIYRETYQRVMVAFQREDFQNIGDASTNDDVSVGYNVTP